MSGAKAFTVLIDIVAKNSAAGVMSSVAKNLLGLNVSARQLTSTMNGLKVAAGGAVVAMAGIKILEAFKTPLDKAGEFQMELAKFKTMGMGEFISQDAEKFSKGMNIMGSSVIDNMKIFTEAQGIFRESGKLNPVEQLASAKMVAPSMAKMNYIQKTQYGLDDEAVKNSNMAAFRFIEDRGGLRSPAEFNSIMDAATKTLNSSGGNVGWEQLRQFMLNAKGTAYTLSDTALFGEMEPLIQILGQRAGTGWYQGSQRATGHLSKMPNNALQEFLREGLWNPAEIIFNSQGGMKGRRNKGPLLKDESLFLSDPIAWYYKDLRPKYDSQKMDFEHRQSSNMLMFGGTGGQFFNEVDRNGGKLHDSISAQARALGLTGTYDEMQKTYLGKKQDTKAMFETAMVQLGEVILPSVIVGLTAFNKAMKGLTDWMAQHPVKTKWIVGAIAALGVVLTVVGIIAVVVGAFMVIGAGIASAGGAAVVATIVAIAGMIGEVLVALMMLPWTKIGASISQGFTWLTGHLIDWVTHIPEAIWNGMRGKGFTYDSTVGMPPVNTKPPAPMAVPPPAATQKKPAVYHVVGKVDGRAVMKVAFDEKGNDLYNKMPTGPSSSDPRLSHPMLS